MAPHNEEDDPAVYRHGGLKKPAANGETSHDVSASNEGTKADENQASSGGANGSKKGSSPAPANADVEMDDEDEEDSTLLTVQPGFNRLLLVLRDERVMRFVKYVSAAAEGSRWDVCGEYEVGMMAEDEDEP
jgi:hypothetical protein